MKTATTKFIFMVTFLSIGFYFAPIAVADILYRNRPVEALQDGDILFRFIADATDTHEQVTHSFRQEGQGMFATNANTNQDFRLFCGDVFTPITSDFQNGTGQAYNAVSLNSAEMTFYSDLQKTRLNSLFSHVYNSAFDSNGEMRPGLEAQLFQYAIWEIMHETSEHLSILDGSFRVTAAGWSDSQASPSWGYGFSIDDPNFENYSQLTTPINMLQTWFNAIENGSWDGTAYSEDSALELTVYIAEGGSDISQTLISVVAPTATPEPASLLIFGIGSTILFPILRRKKRWTLEPRRDANSI